MTPSVRDDGVAAGVTDPPSVVASQLTQKGFPRHRGLVSVRIDLRHVHILDTGGERTARTGLSQPGR